MGGGYDGIFARMRASCEKYRTFADCTLEGFEFDGIDRRWR
jgi:hypothetical protein